MQISSLSLPFFSSPRNLGFPGAVSALVFELPPASTGYCGPSIIWRITRPPLHRCWIWYLLESTGNSDRFSSRESAGTPFDQIQRSTLRTSVQGPLGQNLAVCGVVMIEGKLQNHFLYLGSECHNANVSLRKRNCTMFTMVRISPVWIRRCFLGFRENKFFTMYTTVNIVNILVWFRTWYCNPVFWENDFFFTNFSNGRSFTSVNSKRHCINVDFEKGIFHTVHGDKVFLWRNDFPQC